MKRILVLSLLLTSLSTATHADDSITLSGKLTLPSPRCTLHLKEMKQANHQHFTHYILTTDAAGRFLTNIHPSTYQPDLHCTQHRHRERVILRGREMLKLDASTPALPATLSFFGQGGTHIVNYEP